MNLEELAMISRNEREPILIGLLAVKLYTALVQ
jgi:hypothetical protein